MNLEFLKGILGDELYKQISEKITAYNGDEANKDKQIKLANLTEGGYVSKDKYSTLETDHNSKLDELKKANELIKQLKKSAGNDEDVQNKIKDYEQQIRDLQAENLQIRTENALKFALSQAGGSDIDYLVFKAKEKGEIKLGDDGKIKNESDLITGLKTQLPNMFADSKKDEDKKILENNLPDGDNNTTITQEQFDKMGYQDRLKVYTDNPDLYKELSNN